MVLSSKFCKPFQTQNHLLPEFLKMFGFAGTTGFHRVIVAHVRWKPRETFCIILLGGWQQSLGLVSLVFMNLLEVLPDLPLQMSWRTLLQTVENQKQNCPGPQVSQWFHLCCIGSSVANACQSAFDMTECPGRARDPQSGGFIACSCLSITTAVILGWLSSSLLLFFY